MFRRDQSTLHAVGVMTGTSIDGIDAALVRIDQLTAGRRATVLKHISRPLGPISTDLRRAAEQQPMSAGEFALLALQFGRLHATVIADLLDQDRQIDLIAVHGQTIVHNPPVSWQLINPAPIAEAFSCPVVSDLRQADLARGGQGAPITPRADWVLFRDAHHRRAVINLGGYCNVSILPVDDGSHDESDVRGFDVCACNQVLDAAARAGLGRSFDADGRAGLAGTVNEPASRALLDILHDQRTAGRSLGTGDEASQWVSEHIGTLQPNDLLASAVAAISHCIADALHEHQPDQCIIAGGGTRNAALVRALERHLDDVRVSDALGVPAAAREAAAMAVLGCERGGHAVFLPMPSSTTAAR